MPDKTAWLDAMGIVRWRLRRPPAGPDTRGSAAETASPPDPDAAEAPDWAALARAVAACTRCALHQSRTQTVFGVGAVDAAWMLVGEAPGAEEDAQGEPFVGRAGQLLNAMLEAVGLSRERVYIANVLKCRPPGNRDPKPEEIAACLPYLQRQIDWVAPRLILALGRVAAQTLLETDRPTSALRGRVHTLPGRGIPVVVTYHPAYLLRRPGEKRKAWADLQLAWRQCPVAR
ncbi:MAG: hypothetical protein KatS3mg121_0336 [Gammaproteobacteria bacterium]|nr:MAG: hypothetical protein KatS3mg121_0336 [Gammaproteobacteria bacterium]